MVLTTRARLTALTKQHDTIVVVDGERWLLQNRRREHAEIDILRDSNLDDRSAGSCDGTYRYSMHFVSVLVRNSKFRVCPSSCGDVEYTCRLCVETC